MFVQDQKFRSLNEGNDGGARGLSVDCLSAGEGRRDQLAVDGLEMTYF